MPRVAKKPQRKRALAPRTKKAEPADSIGQPLLFSPIRVGIRVTEETALTLSAVWACVRVISEDIAGLPWHVMERRGRGSDFAPDDPSDWLLRTQASPEVPAFQFREVMVAHALTWGNGYAEIERDGAGRPLWLWLITPDRVTPFRNADGAIWYEVTNPSADPAFVPAADMFHLRGLGFDGLVGYSVIQLAARSIAAGIAVDQSTADLFVNDSTPGGILKHPGRLSDVGRTNLAASWERRHAGPNNRRRVAILEEGMSWEQTGLPPEDTKLIEQRQFTPADICRWFRVTPVKVQDLTRATFSNVEELGIWHVTDTITPWVRRLETEANIKLFGRTNRGRRFTKINLNGLLRGNVASRGQFYTQMFDRGVLSVNDILDLEDRSPIGPDGDKRFVPLNMQLLEDAGEGLEPAVVPTDAPESPESPDAGKRTGGKVDAVGTDVQGTALNGAQVVALVDIATRVAMEQLPPEGARALIRAAFPGIPDELVDQIVDEMDKFEPSGPPGGTPGGGPPADEDSSPGGEEPADDALRAALLPVFEDAARRLLRRESLQARDALRRGVATVEAWYARVAAEHLSFVRDVFRPGVLALAAARRVPPVSAETALAVFADAHMEGLKSRLAAAAADPASLAGWDAAAGGLAALLTDQIPAPPRGVT